MIDDCVGVCRSEDAKRKHRRLQESHRIHAKVADNNFAANCLAFGSDLVLLVYGGCDIYVHFCDVFAIV